MVHYRAEWPLLVIAPSSVRGVWADELEKWLAPCGVTPADLCLPRSGADVAGLATARVVVVTYAPTERAAGGPITHTRVRCGTHVWTGTRCCCSRPCWRTSSRCVSAVCWSTRATT